MLQFLCFKAKLQTLTVKNYQMGKSIIHEGKYQKCKYPKMNEIKNLEIFRRLTPCF